jgi:hypothetical protein
MSIRYSIVENTLPDGSKVFRAQVHPVRVVSFEELMDLMVSSDSATAKSTVLRVCEVLGTVVADLLADGYSVSMPWSVLRPSIRGSFKNTEDAFDPRRHQVVVSAVAGKRVREKMEAAARVEKAQRDLPNPVVMRFEDQSTGKNDSIVTPGETGVLYGNRLKFEPADPQQGVFFVAEDKSETRHGDVILNEPAKLMFRVPVLAPGKYSLFVRAKPYGCPRRLVGYLDKPLTVLEGLAAKEG